MKQMVLIVEDEPRLAEIHRKYLEQAGYETHVLDDGKAVTPWVKENMPSLILLDLMLPGCDGLDICKKIRQFSKRQMTWLKRDEAIQWFPPENREVIFECVKDWLSN